MEFISYRKYRTEEDALALVDILKSNQIEYRVVNIPVPVDLTFTGGTGMDDKIAVKLRQPDFEKVDHLLQEIATDNLDLVEEDHYLFDFSDDELFEVLENYTEWCKTDYLLAHKILRERGHNIQAEKIKELKQKKIDELKKAEKGHGGWLTFGYISALLGGLLGIFIGFHHFKFKKRIPTGEKVYAYDLDTRRTGMRIFFIGIFAFIFWTTIWFLDII